MKKYFLIALCSFLGLGTQACGGGDWNEEYDFYSLLNQCWYLSNPELGPFLYDGDEHYHSECGNEAPEYHSENLSEWKRFFKDAYTIEEIRQCMYGLSVADFDIIRSGRTPTGDLSKNPIVRDLGQGKHSEYAKYLEYAVKCGPYVASLDYYTWGEKRRDTGAYLEMITVGKKLYIETTSDVLKIRYTYQMVRLAHYANEYDYALEIYQKYAPKSLEKAGAFKYYLIEQMGGVYRGFGRMPEAMSSFIEVFTHSKDRRESALSSIHLTRGYNWQEIDTWKEREEQLSTDERIYFHLMSATNGYSFGELKEVLALDPSHPVAEVLFMHVLKEAEKETFERVGLQLLSPKEEMEALLDLCDKYQDQLPKNDFYPFAIAYAHLLKGDYKQSELLFKDLRNSGSGYRGSLLQCERIAHIAGMQRIGPAEENWLGANPLLGNFSELASRLLGHQYLMQQDTAKAFLCARSSNYFLERFDLPLMDLVEAFHEMKEKNAWENTLNNRVDPKHFAQVKGLFYLRKGDLDRSASYFEKGDMALLSHSEGLFVSNLRDYKWDDFEVFNQGEAAYAHSKELSRIPDLATHLDLVHFMQSLEKRAAEGKEAAVCYEMLGSAFYNLLTYGYRRGVINRDYNFGSFADSRVDIVPLYDFQICELHQKGSSITDYGEHFVYGSYLYTHFPFNDPRVAQGYFQKALSATSARQRESRARLTFALAKCEQVFEFQGEEELLNIPKPYFDTLIEEYQDTEYYKKAYSSCSYLENYYQENYR